MFLNGRHARETQELFKRAAERDKALLQSHLATAQRLLSSGIRVRSVKTAREEMAKHLGEAERAVTKDAKVRPQLRPTATARGAATSGGGVGPWDCGL